MSEKIMPEEAGISPQPRLRQNEEIRLRKSPNLKLGIFQRTMNWCGRNKLATAIIVIMFIIILVLQSRFFERSRLRSFVLSSMKQRAGQGGNISPKELRRFQEALDPDK